MPGGDGRGCRVAPGSSDGGDAQRLGIQALASEVIKPGSPPATLYHQDMTYSLKAKPSRLQPKAPERAAPKPTASRRINGRKRQQWRQEAWAKALGCCAMCGKLMRFPDGFELDHIIPLCAGGADDTSNMQVLCVSWQPDGSKAGCHAAKTAEEAAQGWIESGGGRVKSRQF